MSRRLFHPSISVASPIVSLLPTTRSFDLSACRRHGMVLLTSFAFFFSLGAAAADEASEVPHDAAFVSKVKRASGTPLLWRPSGEVRQSTIYRLQSDTTQTEVSTEELALLAQRVRNSKGALPAHGKSWLKFEVELDPAQVKPLSPETPLPRVTTEQQSHSNKVGDDFEIYVDSIVTTGFGAVPEPTTVAVGDFVFYTANHFYAMSDDGGESFTLFDPFAGPFAPPGADFCCDQTSVYDPQTDTIFFLQQYVPTETTGVQRISVDQGADGSFECAYDVTPQVSGFPTNRWADFPDLALSANYLFHSSNVFDTQQSGLSVGAFVHRYSLADISACKSSVSFNTMMDTEFSGFRFTRGAGEVMHFASHISNEAMRIWSWPDSAPEPTFVDRTVTPWMTGPRTCIGPDDREYCDGVDNRLQSGWVADGVVGFMWSPAQGGEFPYPYTRTAHFSTSDLSLVDENDISSMLSAFIYPSVAVNNNEDLGGAIMVGGGEFPVTGMVWIADDANGDQLVPIDIRVVSSSGIGPTGGRIGDYTMAHTYYPDTSQWVATTFGFLADLNTGATLQFPGFHRFGRAEVGEPEVPIFADGFESGDLSAWDQSTVR